MILPRGIIVREAHRIHLHRVPELVAAVGRQRFIAGIRAVRISRVPPAGRLIAELIMIGQLDRLVVDEIRHTPSGINRQKTRRPISRTMLTVISVTSSTANTPKILRRNERRGFSVVIAFRRKCESPLHFYFAFFTRNCPITSASMSDLAKVLSAFCGVVTIGSPRRLYEVFSSTGTPVASPNFSTTR